MDLTGVGLLIKYKMQLVKACSRALQFNRPHIQSFDKSD
jgi:hypothetical protein